MYITQPIISFFTPTIPVTYALQSRDLRVGHRYRFLSIGNRQFYAEFVRLAVGGRYEDSEQITETFNRISGDPIVVTQKAEYLLPAATLTWEFYDNMQLRFAFSQTLSRPDLRETASAFFIDDRGQQTRGNPELEITEIDNYDPKYNDKSLKIKYKCLNLTINTIPEFLQVMY